MTPTITLVDAKSTVARYQGTLRLPGWGGCSLVRMGLGVGVAGLGMVGDSTVPKCAGIGGSAIAIGLSAMYSEGGSEGGASGFTSE